METWTAIFALDSRRHEVDHPPLQLDHQTVQTHRCEVRLAHLRWVTGPGSAAEVGQWHGALVPGLAAPLGFQAAFPHPKSRDPRLRKVPSKVVA